MWCGHSTWDWVLLRRWLRCTSAALRPVHSNWVTNDERTSSKHTGEVYKWATSRLGLRLSNNILYPSVAAVMPIEITHLRRQKRRDTLLTEYTDAVLSVIGIIWLLWKRGGPRAIWSVQFNEGRCLSPKQIVKYLTWKKGDAVLPISR